MHTCIHAHTCACIHRLVGRKSSSGECRLIGLQDCWGRGRGGGALTLIRKGGGGGGGPLAIRHQTRGIDQPPWLQACIHTHGTHAHTHTMHTLTHVCMCIAVCVHTCPHTYTEILLDSKYTLREVRFFAIGTTQKSCIAFLTFGQRIFTIVTYKICKDMLKIYFIAHA